MKNKTWKLRYDKETDQLFVGEYPMPRGSQMFKIGNDVDLYINKNGDIKGIFIEYYQSDLKKRLKELFAQANR